ncbi:AbrB family transcriptional regulator [Pseudorhizobium endolithicum]|uniref:AbrB family transcriptional regulator n=1 Tax=Pseudorhizobium endolithicum TaxID=1191678 RepID=A0ABM8PJM9_9HYPH|nr:AbrB/MazE/SpoVT family DNA-binding domain-containing protein [Pseudorhizobium endolithicum]CAD7033491.1 AbrB family transcriptional regulator [Pseudorhizobium endolithicum]
MNVTIRKIGNSEGIIIPKEVLDRLGLKAGDSVEIREEGGSISLIPEQADLTEQLKAARIGMQKYKIALRELAK